MTRVLPLPAAATISSGPSTCVTASRCASVRSSRSVSVDNTIPQYGRTAGGSKRSSGQRQRRRTALLVQHERLGVLAAVLAAAEAVHQVVGRVKALRVLA